MLLGMSQCVLAFTPPGLTRREVLAFTPPGLTRREVLAHSAAAATAAASAAAILPPAAHADLGESGRLRQDIGQSAKGDGVQILLEQLSYIELKACPPNFYLPQKGGPWDCIEISGLAVNQGKRDVSAAAVFGQVRDAEGYPCLSTALDDTMKTGIASLGAIPQGSTKVSFVVAIQGRSPRPLSLAGFKASYRNAAIESTFKPFDLCEIDSSACADDEDQPENAKKTISQTGLFGAQY